MNLKTTGKAIGKKRPRGAMFYLKGCDLVLEVIGLCNENLNGLVQCLPCSKRTIGFELEEEVLIIVFELDALDILCNRLAVERLPWAFLLPFWEFPLAFF